MSIRVQTRTEEDGDQEESNQKGHVPNNRTKSDDRNPHQTRLILTVHGKTLDEKVTDHEKDSQTDGADNFSNQNSLPRSPRHIARQLLTRETQPLALETSNPSSGQSTVTDPRVSMCSRVASRHPTNKFSVVDNKVSDGELVGVEEERRNTKANNRNPEVDKMRNPNCKSDEEKNDEGTYTEIDRRSSESGVKNAERDSSGGKTTTSSDIPSTTESQVVENRVHVNLGGEYFEDRRER